MTSLCPCGHAPKRPGQGNCVACNRASSARHYLKRRSVAARQEAAAKALDDQTRHPHLADPRIVRALTLLDMAHDVQQRAKFTGKMLLDKLAEAKLLRAKAQQLAREVHGAAYRGRC